MKINQSKRADFQIISEWIGQNTKVLDLGCGDGALLNFLKTNNNVQGFGIEKDEENWLLSLKNNIDVIQMDLEAGLSGFENNSFDTVILSKTLQAMHNIEEIMQEMLRVGNEVIITFPNFGYWKDRLQVMLGHMPISDELPYQWYNTPNIHLCTLSDFDQFCHKHKMKVLDRLVLTNNKPINVLPNLFGALALYRLIKKIMANHRLSLDQIFNKKSLICIFTGFTSGLPLFILISLLPAWLRSSGLDLKTIGLFALIQFPFTWKFIWAPLFDRFTFSMGRRRGWLIIFQILLLISISLTGLINPTNQITVIASISTVIAFFSASQDVVIDAYRRELLLDHELGLGNAIHVNAYKIASLVPGSLSLILADIFAWEYVFLVTGLFMLPGIVMTILISEPDLTTSKPKTLKEAIIEPFKEFKNRKGLKNALLILLFIFLYKIGDSMATALSTPFYLDLGFSMTEIGLIAKNAGLWPGILGGLLGGIWMIKLGINKALWIFGVLQMLATISFAWLAHVGDNNIVLAITVSLEFFAAGLGTTAFVAYIAKTTNPKYTATQFALFTSLASVPRTLTNASTGYLVDFFGWQDFFIFCALLAIPGILLLFKIAPWHQSE